jgi:tRNA/rRNA methyltransferase
MLDSLKKISVVLVAPQGGLNLGSVARCMANFGFSDLRLVTPEADPNGDDARRMAVRAVGLLEQATHFPDLASALADCHLALGTTRRFGKYREDFMNPDEIGPFVAPALAAGRIALVFGREDKGLFTEELDLCQRFITIPTDDALPSMNLSHAVGLCLYETSQGLRVASGQSGRKRLASGATLDGLYAHMRQSLQEIDFLDEQNPDHILHAFRRIFGRALLNDREHEHRQPAAQLFGGVSAVEPGLLREVMDFLRRRAVAEKMKQKEIVQLIRPDHAFGRLHG